MNDSDEVKRLLSRCTPPQREAIFRDLRKEFPIHPLEGELHAKAEIILEAIQRAGDLTRRMIRGVIAEAAFEIEVIDHLNDWEKAPLPENSAYDFSLKDHNGTVRIQVKLQRSKAGQPWTANSSLKLFRSLPPDMYVVETQKTRGGVAKTTGAPTRPYRFGEFDLLAVAMYPSTRRWSTFMYTVANWLMPDPVSPKHIFKLQPVASKPSDDWTDCFEDAVKWLRSSKSKTIRAQ